VIWNWNRITQPSLKWETRVTVTIITLYIIRTERGRLYVGICQTLGVLNIIYIAFIIYARRVFCRSKIRVAVTKRTPCSVKSRARNSWPTRRPSTDTRPTRKSSTCARPTDGTCVPPLPPPLRSSCTAGAPEIRLPDDRRQTDTNVSPVYRLPCPRGI